jgi:hypothetical protein
VAFSCQRRGFCPSCIGRLCDFAARLVSDVLPRVPIRQWVLTLPHALRAKLAIAPSLTAVALREFVAAVTKCEALERIGPISGPPAGRDG